MNIKEYIFRYKKYILLLAVFALLNTCISFIVPFIIKVLLDNAKLSQISGNYLLLFVLTLVGTYLLTVGYRAFSLKFAFDFKCAEYKTLFEKLFGVKLPTIQSRGPTYFTERILGSGERIFDFIGVSVVDTIVTLLSIIISLTIVFILSKTIFLMFLLLIPVTFLSYRRLNQKLQRKCGELQEVSALNLKSVINIIQNIEAIKQFTDYRPFSNMVGENIYNWQKKTKDVNRYGMLMSATINFATNAIRNGVLLLTVYYFVINKMLLADLVFVNLIFSIYFDAINKLNSININFRDIKASLAFISDEVLSLMEKDTGKEDLLHIDNVSFKIRQFEYSVSCEILSNVQFEIKAGQKIAIVGKAGSGKTTLSKLLMRFYDNVERILVNDKDIYEYSLKSIREKVYLVSQTPYLFPGSVKENIVIGLNSIDKNRLKSVIELPFLLDLIKELPSGLATQIGEGAFNLSGGQKQKIVIARMLMHDPHLIIFDESTSSMDSYSEETVYRDIEPFIKNKIVIKMSHRLSTIEQSDLIIVLKDRGIAHIGKHDELLRISDQYKELFGQQIKDS